MAPTFSIVISWWIFPLFSALMWLSTLLGLLLVWTCNNEPHLASFGRGQTIAYISDTGAFNMKPLFIAGGTVTVVFLDIGFFAERWLRHTGRLAKNTSRNQKILSVLSLIFAVAGAAGLILLTIFDTYRHNHVHDTMLGVFIIGYILSAVCLCAEYQRLGIHYRHHRILAISFWIKLAFIVIEVALGIGFISCSSTKHYNAAAVFEWAVAFIFTFYVLSFVLDLLPSVRTSKHIPQGHKDLIMAEQGQQRFSQSSTQFGAPAPESDVANATPTHGKFIVPAGAPPPRSGLARYLSNLK